jgi:predicted PurR-regulated permease PerM
LFLWAVREAVLLGFAAVLLAVAVHGIADGLTKWLKVPGGLALALAALLLLGIVTAILWLFGAQLASELSAVFERLPEAWRGAQETLQGHPAGDLIVKEVERALSGDAASSIRSMISSAGGFAFPFASGVTTALLVFFAAAFLTTSSNTYFRGALLLFPSGMDEKVGEALKASSAALKKWLLGITFDMVLIALLLGIALWLLGVPGFVGLALIAGLAQFVPTVGPILAAIPGILLAFTVGPMTALWTAVAYLGISQLEANLIYPLIQQRTASIPPAMILLAILAFGILLGPLGVLLATPMLVVLSVFVTKLYIKDALGKEASVPGEG